MTGLFNSVHHICVVVPDLDAAEQAYVAAGIGPWYDYPKGGAYVEFDVPNVKASQQTRYRCADMGDVQLQLCEPSPLDSPQRRFLDATGGGVYHIGFEVDDLRAAEAEGQERRLGVIARGRRADGSGFCYFDTRPALGVILEVRKTPPAAPVEEDRAA